MKVFLLWHEYELNGCDEIKMLGVFSTQLLAEESQKYFETQEGFKDHVDGFEIAEYELDRRQWSAGFFTYRSP